MSSSSSLKRNSTFITLVKRIQGLTEERKEYDVSIQKLTKERREYEVSVKEEIGQLKEQNMDYTTQIEKDKQEIEQYQREIEVKITKHSKELERYQQEAAHYHEKLANSNVQIEALNGQIIKGRLHMQYCYTYVN